ncbi:MAG: TonB-dependent receptor [Flavobacteriales bacterium]|nr:TonB-dependent receptor [Flavobacteriales bacterium]MCB9449200.1 TonB-dependent receptor [Flavobacteriales bacterium]
MVFTFSSTAALAVASGEIKGTVNEKETGEALPFATVTVMNNGAQVAASVADENGRYRIKALDPGTYTVEARYVGKMPTIMKGVQVNAGTVTMLNIEIGNMAFAPIVITPSMVRPDETAGEHIDPKVIERVPTRTPDVKQYAALLPQVYQSEPGGDLYIRGARKEATQIYIDGVKVIGSSNLPGGCINQFSVLTGGIPAEYGDVSGGLILVTTKGYFNH